MFRPFNPKVLDENQILKSFFDENTPTTESAEKLEISYPHDVQRNGAFVLESISPF